MSDPMPWTFLGGGDYTEQMGWLTDVLQAPSGGTQHRMLRTTPRTVVAFQVLESGRRRRLLEQQLRQASGMAWDVPILIDACTVSADVAAGASSVSVQTGIARFAVGGRALLIGDAPDTYEVVTLAAVASGLLTLQAPTTLGWPAGTQVLPLVHGRLDVAPTVSRFTGDDTGLIAMQWRLEGALAATPALSGGSYRSLPVFDAIAPVWTSDPTWSPERLLDSVDNEITTPFEFDLAGVPIGKSTAQYAADNAASVAALRSALFALAGRWQPVWVPNPSQDLAIVAGVAASATTLDIEGPLLSPWPLPPNRRDLRIELLDGTIIYCRINAVTAASATVDRLALDTALPAFGIGDVRSVSWLALSVLDADDVTLRYFTPNAVQCELTWRELDHEL